MDHPKYSDPIVIPITLTIPDPRWRPQGGRWDLGPVYPPLHSGNSPPRPEDRAAHSRTVSPAIERAMAIMDQHTGPAQPPGASPAAVKAIWPPIEQRLAILAQFAGPGSLSAVPPAVVSGSDAREEKELASHVARAMRRIREVAEETARGELGTAAGHLFLGSPYSEDVDTGLAAFVVHNEQTVPPTEQPVQSDTELKQATLKLKRYLEGRRVGALNERHLLDAEADRRGEPILRPDGKPVDHELEVSEAAWGLREEVTNLKIKLRHDIREKTSDSNKDAAAEAEATIKESEDVLNEINRRLPGLRRRVQARKRSRNTNE